MIDLENGAVEKMLRVEVKKLERNNVRLYDALTRFIQANSVVGYRTGNEPEHNQAEQYALEVLEEME